jgi:DNA polymerase III subunit delta
MADLKSAYLIHGDDHGAVAERRAGLCALVDEQLGADASVEALSPDEATPAGLARALAAMTLAVGRRVIVVDGAERWKQAEVEKELAPAMAQMPPETTVAVFAREEARAKAPAALHDAVKRAGGQVVEQMNVKPWELPRWVREQAASVGLALDANAAKLLVSQVGERQQRLLRELEKLALEGPPPSGDGSSSLRPISAEDIEERAARSSEWRAFALADALVAADGPAATRTYLRLREQGERLAGLTYLMAQRLRDATAVSQRLAAGESAAEIKRSLRMPARAADRLIADVARSDPQRLGAALGVLAEMELDSRGGAVLGASRSPAANMSEDTLAVRAIEAICA